MQNISSSQHFLEGTRRIPKFILFTIFFACTFLCFYWYRNYISYDIAIIDSVILIISGLVFGFICCSIYRNPNQFFSALKERVLLPFALLLALMIRMVGAFISLLMRSIRLLFSLIIVILYDVWPIDLIPDIILGIGWADDVIVTIVGIYIGLVGGKFVISQGIKETSRGLIESSRIKTKFP